MSMHIVGPYLTTTSTKKRKEKVTKAQQEELERGWRERNQRLKQMGFPKETLEQYTDFVHGRSKDKKKKTQHEPANKAAVPRQDKGVGCPQQADTNNPNVQNTNRKMEWITGPVSSKPSPTYTGENIIGIAVMHKSCLQPIFNKQAAEDVAKMRR